MTEINSAAVFMSVLIMTGLLGLNILILSLCLKLYTEIMKEKSQRSRRAVGEDKK